MAARFGGVSRGSHLAVAALVLALSACTSMQRKPEAVSGPASIASVKPLDISGRISLRQGKEGHSGAVRWFYDPPHHDIRMLSPLGQIVARIVENAQGVTLTTADKQNVQAQDPDELVETVLGWRLPLKGLQHWLLAIPAPDSPAKTELDNEQHIARILQDDWEILYSNYQAVRGTELPGRIEMRRDDIRVRLVIDSWKPVLQAQ